MTNKPRRRRRWPAAALILSALCVWFVWQQESIVTETYTLACPGLPAAFDGLRIVQISDLHGKQFGEGGERLLEATAALEPDLIAITGDLVDQAEQLETLPALAEALAAIAPTYYVTGNHEWAVNCVNEIKALLERGGVTPLTNEYALLERAGGSIVVAGIDDPNGPADQKTGAQLRAEIAAGMGDGAFTLLLAHRDSVEDYAAWGYDVALCGHGHGGVIRIPILNRGVLSTDRTLFPQYDGGAYELAGGGWCVVSRGLGSNTVPARMFRLFNRPDLPLIVLKSV